MDLPCFIGIYQENNEIFFIDQDDEAFLDKVNKEKQIDTIVQNIALQE